MIHVDYPYGFDGTGRTATTTGDDHIRDMIEQVLFTAPGERVNRPSFGSGLLALMFEPNADALVAAIRANVESSLQRWLGDVIEVEAVQIRNIESVLEISVQFVMRGTRDRRFERFRRTGAM